MKDIYAHFALSERRVMVVISVIALMITGCSTVPKTTDTLERTRSAYVQARSNPDIVSHAPIAMREAGKALGKAQEAENFQEMERMAYLAKTKVELAVVTAERKIAEKKIELLAREKQKVQTDSLRYEAEQARKEAEAKADEAEERAFELETRSMELKAKTREAEVRAREAEAARREAELARAETRKLKQELSQLKAERTNRGMVLTLGDVLFESGKARLMPGAVRQLDGIADFLEENPNRNVLIEGHTDSRGGEAINRSLSQHRADAVRDVLAEKGIRATRITTKGYGRNYPVASNKTEAGRQQNRRVEIIVLDEGIDAESMFR